MNQLNPTQAAQLIVLGNHKRQKHPELRLGQSYMNALSELDNEIYDAITGTELDPFYDDSKVDAFLETIWPDMFKDNLDKI